MRKQPNTTLTTVRKQEGASLIEYAVLAALIVVAAVTAIGALGTDLTAVFTNITSKI